MNYLTILRVRVGKEPDVVTIENIGEKIREIIGGWMETVRIADDILLIVDEEGLLKRSPFNFNTIVVDNGVVIPKNAIHGNAFFCSILGENFHSLDKLQIQRVKKMFEVRRDLCVVQIR